MQLPKRLVSLLVVLALAIIVLPWNVAAQANRPVIVFDPGHGIANSAGRIDPGAVSGSLIEKDITLDVAKAARSALANCPVQVYLTREGDDLTHTLEDVAELVNQLNPDVGVAIHVNSSVGNPTGTESWYTVGGYDDQGSQQLGRLLSSRIANDFGIPDRGVKAETSNRHGGLYFHWWNAPSALVEIAFLQGDAELLRNERTGFGQMIALSVLEYLGLSNACVGAASQPPTGNTSTSTVLLLDISGSMGNSWQGGVKIESAKSAAADLVTMMEQEARTSNVSHRVGVATFSSIALVDLAPTTDYALARSVIGNLFATDGTNIGEGLRVANQALAGEPTGSQRFIILLSDGMTNEGLSPPEILSGPVQDAVNSGICIHTVGFGDPGDLDEALLRDIAAASGCGEYYYASDAYQLSKIYLELRHRSLGQVVASISGDVQQSQTTSPQPFNVPAQQGELNITLAWPGSTLDLVVTDPRGRQVDSSYPGVSLAPYERFVYMIVQDPVPGDWKLAVFGRDVPEGIINYDAVASVRAAPAAQAADLNLGGPALIVVGAMALLALVLATVAILRQSARTAPTRAGVAVQQAHGGGARAGFRRNVLRVGRDPRNELALADEQVSRLHAQIRREAEGYVLYDLNSKNGTFVNGQQIARCRLRPGDRIRVGATTLVFFE